MNKNQNLGRWGEDLAYDFIINKGLLIIARNARTAVGEIDLIALDSDQVVFIEVKTRSSTRLEIPEESVKEKKRLHLIKAADAYMQAHDELPDNWRIDVIAITGTQEKANPEIEWFKNAVE